MKKQFLNHLLIWLLFSSATFAQKAKLGPISENEKGELLTTDPVHGKQHYKVLSFTLKAGSGIVFYMTSSSFTPLVWMQDKDGLDVGLYQHPEKGKGQEATAVLNAFNKYPDYSPKDISFNIFFSSIEENATGLFGYGYYLLDSTQKIYDEKGPLSNRLTYLINNWQTGWWMIPVDKNSPEPHWRDAYTHLCLMPGKTQFPVINTGTGNLSSHELFTTGSYFETIFESKTDKGAVVYDKLINEIKQCIGDKQWNFKTEIKEDKNLNEKYFSTIFQIKGAVKNQARSVFSIVRIVPAKIEEYHPYEIMLFFN